MDWVKDSIQTLPELEKRYQDKWDSVLMGRFAGSSSEKATLCQMIEDLIPFIQKVNL